jgi:hypothetical protein
MKTILRKRLSDMDNFVLSIKNATDSEIQLAIRYLLKRNALDIKEMLGI